MIIIRIFLTIVHVLTKSCVIFALHKVKKVNINLLLLGA